MEAGKLYKFDGYLILGESFDGIKEHTWGGYFPNETTKSAEELTAGIQKFDSKIFFLDKNQIFLCLKNEGLFTKRLEYKSRIYKVLFNGKIFWVSTHNLEKHIVEVNQ